MNAESNPSGKQADGKPDTCGHKWWPSSCIFPISLPLYDYKFRHGTTGSNDPDPGFVGRQVLLQRLFTWLKLNHKRTGTGNRHGCYLVTGYRGVGKTSFVNRALYHYNRWLQWLYGDDGKHTDEIRINLGTGYTSAKQTLQTLAERLYVQTCGSFWSRLVQHNVRWLSVLTFSVLVLFFLDSALRQSLTMFPLDAAVQTTAIAATYDGGADRHADREPPTTVPDALHVEFFRSLIDVPRAVYRAATHWFDGTATPLRARPSVDTESDRFGGRVRTRPHILFDRGPIDAILIGKREARPDKMTAPDGLRRMLLPLPLVLFCLATLWEAVIATSSDWSQSPRPLARRIAVLCMLIVVLGRMSRHGMPTGLTVPLTSFCYAASIWFIIIKGRTLSKIAPESVALALAAVGMVWLWTIRTPGDSLIKTTQPVRDAVWNPSSSQALALLSITGLGTLLASFASPRGRDLTGQPHRQHGNRGKPAVFDIQWLPRITPGTEFALLRAALLLILTVVLLYLSLAVDLATRLFMFFSFFSLAMHCQNRLGQPPFRRAYTNAFGATLSVIKAMAALLVIGVFMAVLESIEGVDLLSPAIVVIKRSCADLIGVGIIALPVLSIVSLYAYKTGMERHEEEAISEVATAEKEQGSRARKEIMTSAFSLPMPHCLLQRWSYEVRYQRKLRHMHQRLRNTIETQVKMTSSVRGGVLALGRRKTALPYTGETLEADLIDTIDCYGKAFPDRDLIVIFDELDRIHIHGLDEKHDRLRREPDDVRGEQVETVRALLGELKNLLLTAEARFVFVAGADLQEHWLADISEYEHLISSLFSHPLMVPTLLTDPTDSMTSDATSLIAATTANAIISPQTRARVRGLGRKRLSSPFADKNFAYLPVKSDHAADGDLSQASQLSQLLDHIDRFPTVNSVATHFAARFAELWNEPEKLYSIYTSHCNAGLITDVPFYQTFTFIDFVNYLTFRSIGIPRLVFLFFDRYVTEGRSKGKLELRFDSNSMHPVQLISYLYQLFHVDISETIKEHGDKLVMSALYFVGYMCRHHRSAFDRSTIESMRHVLSPHHAPQVRDIIHRLMTLLERLCLIPIRNGVYDYRFTEHVRHEIRYASLVDSTVRPIFNFAQEQNEEIRQQYTREAEKALKDASKKRPSSKSLPQYRGVLGAYYRIGQLHEGEEQYERALVSYRRSIQEFRQVYDGVVAANDRLSLDDVSNLVLVIRSLLRIGLVYERVGNVNSALSSYLAARDYADCIFRVFEARNWESPTADQLGDPSHFLDIFCPRLCASPVLLQPYLAVSFLLMKGDQTSPDADRYSSIKLLSRHLGNLQSYVRTCLKDIEKDVHGSNRKAASPKLTKDQRGVAQEQSRSFRNALTSLNFLQATCIAREGDLEFFGGNMARAAMKTATLRYVEAVRIQMGESFSAKKLEEWSGQQKESFACALSHLGDSLFAYHNDDWVISREEKALKTLLDLCASLVENGDNASFVSALPEVSKRLLDSLAGVAVRDVAHGTACLKRMASGDCAQLNHYRLWVVSSLIFADIGENLRAGLQMNKCLMAMQKACVRSIGDTDEEGTQGEDRPASSGVVDRSVWQDAIVLFKLFAERWYRIAYEHAYKWATNKDRSLTRRISMEIDASDAWTRGEGPPPSGDRSAFRFRPTELRECDVIALQIRLCLQDMLCGGDAHGQHEDSLKKLVREVTNQAHFFGYRAFPVRVRLRFLELYGDLMLHVMRKPYTADQLGLTPVTTGCGSLRAKDKDLSAEEEELRWIYEVWLEGARSFDSAIDIRSTLGPSFSMTHFSLATLHHKLGDINRVFDERIETLCGKTGGRHADSSQHESRLSQFRLALKTWGRHPQFPLSRSEVTVGDWVYQYNLARDAYRASIAAHRLQQEHAALLRSYCYLTDDFHSEDVHFAVAYEVFMQEYSLNRIRVIDKELANNVSG